MSRENRIRKEFLRDSLEIAKLVANMRLEMI
jgi:hypothetical protein